MSGEINWLDFFEDRERLYADFYLDFAQQYARRDAEAYDQLEAESGNLLKIASWLAEHNDDENILKLAEALWQQSDFLRSRGFMQRGLPLLEQAHQAARQVRDLIAELIYLDALAYVYFSISDFTSAQSLYEQALVIALTIDEPQYKARIQLGIGRLQMDVGNLEEATNWLKQALQNYRHCQDSKGEIATLTALGNLLSLQGEFADAKAFLKRGLLVAQAQQDLHSEAELRYALGYAAALAKDWAAAINHFEMATDIAQVVGNHFLEIRGLHNLGEAWLFHGDSQKAVILLEKALACQEISDDIQTKAFTHFYLAKAYYIQNDPDKSLLQLEQSYPYFLNIEEAPIAGNVVAEAAWMKAINYLRQGHLNLAQTALRDFLDLSPTHMADIHRKAIRLLETIENGDEIISSLVE